MAGEFAGVRVERHGYAVLVHDRAVIRSRLPDLGLVVVPVGEAAHAKEVEAEAVLLLGAGGTPAGRVFQHVLGNKNVYVTYTCCGSVFCVLLL